MSNHEDKRQKEGCLPDTAMDFLGEEEVGVEDDYWADLTQDEQKKIAAKVEQTFGK